MDVLVISYLRVFSGCNQMWNIALSAHKRTAAFPGDLLFKRTQLSAVWGFCKNDCAFRYKSTPYSPSFCSGPSHFNATLGCICFSGSQRWFWWLAYCWWWLLLSCRHGDAPLLPRRSQRRSMFGTNLIFPSASLQVTTYPVSQARLLSRQLRPRTGSIRPSRRSAAAHWPIRGARARRPQPAWRPTCRVRRNASSCRTAGS